MPARNEYRGRLLDEWGKYLNLVVTMIFSVEAGSLTFLPLLFVGVDRA